KAALRLKCTYNQIKDWVRNSIEHSFLPGESIFQPGQEKFVLKPLLGFGTELFVEPVMEAQEFINSSLKAQMQIKLEHELQKFEQSQFKSKSQIEEPEVLADPVNEINP